MWHLCVPSSNIYCNSCISIYLYENRKSWGLVWISCYKQYCMAYWRQIALLASNSLRPSCMGNDCLQWPIILLGENSQLRDGTWSWHSHVLNTSHAFVVNLEIWVQHNHDCANPPSLRFGYVMATTYEISAKQRVLGVRDNTS